YVLSFHVNHSPTLDIYPVSLHDALPISDRALVAVDTDGRSYDGSKFEFSKLLALPHANMVLACRGERVFFSQVFNRLHCAPKRRSEEHTSELQSRENLVCRLLLEKKKK